ncbi:MAG: extracellular solute-binding protein [Anaerolineae bacterium]|nr:extracellular solute-binding protein [Anaerolineae bacterium]
MDIRPRLLCLALLVSTLIIAPISMAQDSTAPSIMTRNAEGQTITAWGWDTPEFNKPILDYIQEAAGVTVDDVTYSNADVFNNITVAAAAGVGLPDVFKGGSTAIPALVEMGAVMDITDLVEPYMDLLPQVGWDMMTYEGRIWGVPANSPAGGVFWRYSTLEQYGIDPTTIETWDDFIAAGEKIESESGGTVGMLQMPAVGLPTEILWSIQQGYKAQVIGENDTVMIGPDSTEWQQTLALWRKLRDSGVGTEMDAWTQPWYTAIQDGSIAAFPIGTWFVETIKQQAPDSQGEWYFTPMPANEAGGSRYPSFGSATAFISATTEHPEAAMEWVKAWTMDPHGALDIGLKELGISVISNAALTDPYVTAPHEFFANDQAYWYDATESFANIPYVPPTTVHSAEANDIFNRHLEQWWLGNETDEQFLQGTADELRSSLGIE